MRILPDVGARIETKRFGFGRVVRYTTSGVVVALDKLGGLELEILPSETIASTESTNGRSTTVARPERQAVPPVSADPVAALLQRALASMGDESEPVIDVERLNARRSIEALRFGIVPSKSIQAITVGFDELRTWVLRQLPSERGSPRVSEVSGRFGTGKSHTMAAIRHIAEAEGFAHAQVEVDGNEVSLSDPAGVLRQLWKTLSAKDLHSNTPLVELMVRAASKGATRARHALERYPRVQSNLLLLDNLADRLALDAHSENLELLLACSDELSGVTLGMQIANDPRMLGSRWQHSDVPTTPKVIIGRKIEERPDDFVNCLLGYAVVCRLAGYKGLVITIDEFEVEYNLDRKKRERLQAVLDRLSERLSDDDDTGDAPLSLIIATVGQDGEDGDKFVDALVDSTGGERHVLDDWEDELQLEVAERIAGVYSTAYASPIPYDQDAAAQVLENLEAADGSSVIRAFIKRYVAHLDWTYGPPT